MTNSVSIRTYRPEDLPALVALINEADEFDQQERATTLEQMEHEMSFPDYFPATDCFLAWQNGRLVGYADLLLVAEEFSSEATVYTWGLVHPQWRRRGLGRRLLDRLYQRASERLVEVEDKPVHF